MREIKSGTYDVLRTLSDGKFHSVYELNELHGWKVCSRISDLIAKGCSILKERVEENRPELKYRLVFAPKELTEKIRVSRLDNFDHLKVPSLF